ncbi:MAG: thiamine phosphate synthase [Gemmatimonadota bacterium]
MSRPDPDVRLIVITDAGLAAPRSMLDVAAEAAAAGAPAIQLRHKSASARELLGLATALRSLIDGTPALLFVNDRLDVALASGADGVHLGPDDLPVAAARRAAPPGFLIGYSTDDPALARRAEADGAAYIGCGAVFGTTTKAVGDERIGLERLAAVTAAVAIPVVGIGGITPATVHSVLRAGAAGVAVVGAVMAAADVRAAVGALLGTLRR